MKTLPFSIGSMSDKYPQGFYPASSSVPPQWTNAQGQPAYVQYNGLVYVKTERHTGGTQPPNEEEVNGLRTWKLYTTRKNMEKGFRYHWQHLHQSIAYNATTSIVYDEDAYSGAAEYFRTGSTFNAASQNLWADSTISSDLRFPIPAPAGFYPGGAVGIFEEWHENSTPTSTLQALNGYNGYESPRPDATPPYPDPPTLPPITFTFTKFIQATEPFAVGKTYTGYVESLSKTGSWVWSELYQNYIYEFSPVTVGQVPISHTVSKADFISTLEGIPLDPPPEEITHTIYGGQDLWVGWGKVILTSVTPSADA